MKSFLWRSWITAATLISAVLAVLAVLSIIQFETILSNLVHGRLSVLAQTVEAPFKSATDLGLPLSSVRNAPEILERARETDPDISAIHVFDTLGTIVHSTDPEHPDSVRAEALFAQTYSQGSVWHAETEQHFLSGATISDPAGARLGGVLLVYPKTEFEAAWSAMTTRLALYLILTLCLVSGVGIVVLRFGLRALIHMFARIDNTLAALEQRERHDGAMRSDISSRPAKGSGVDIANLEHMLGAADDRYASVGAKLVALEANSDEPTEAVDRPSE